MAIKKRKKQVSIIFHFCFQNIAASSVSGWVYIILPSILANYCHSTWRVRFPDHIFVFGIAFGVVHLFHSWNTWSNWKFISSPPDVLQIMCGSRASGEADEDSNNGCPPTVSNEEEGSESRSGFQTQAAAENSRENKPVEKGRCLLFNLCIGVSWFCSTFVRFVQLVHWSELVLFNFCSFCSTCALE